MKKLLFTILAIGIYHTGFAQNKITQDKDLFQSSYIKPQKIESKAAGHYFIDFGKDAFGALILSFKATQYDSLIIHIGENLSDKNTIDKNPGGTIRYQKIILTNVPVNKQFQVELPQDGRNDHYPAVILPDSFGRIIPFRYCEIENLKVPISEVNISQKVFNYRFNDDASAFTCSDTVLNQVWEMCKHTIKATSFCGLYIDGDRERIPYEADALINQLSHYSVDSEYTLAQRTNEYFIDHPTWPTEWILHTVLLFYYDYMYTGDTKYISKHYERLKNKTLMALEQGDGLINTKPSRTTKEFMNSVGFQINYTGRPIEDIVDWPKGERDGYEMAGINTVVNSFYYLNLKLMAEIAGVLNKKKDADFFYNKSLLVKKTINKKLIDPTTGLYIDGEGSKHSSLHANMFPVAFGIVPEENTDKVVSFIKSRRMACSVYGAQYLLEALYKIGEADYALSLMNATEGDRNWWNMIRTGSTMTLEAWDMKYKPNLDWNHAWGTAPANIITRYVWGITPSRPGFETVTIKPQMSEITFSTIKVPTIKGAIYAEFKKTNNASLYIIDLPAGIKGKFIPVDIADSEIILNGKPVLSNDELPELKEGTNRIEIIKP
jgi:alpha-L-rhamnosidase